MSQKIENLLNLALGTGEEERRKSEELDVGYSSEQRMWELIIKYSGELEETKQIANTVTELLNGYAVVTVDEEKVEQLAQLPEIDYIEKPKSLYFQVENGRRTSCIDPVQASPLSLRGNGVLIGIADSGIDYTNQNFRNADGTTRIVALWDQSVPGNPPKGYAIGSEYGRSQIDEALSFENAAQRFSAVPSADAGGHGTAVAGIAAGNGFGSEGGRLRGVAPEAELIIVKMGPADPQGFPRTTQLMLAVDYIVRKAEEIGRPVAVNISFGNTYGSHDGTSLVERFLNDIADTWKNVICVGSGNEGNAAGHVQGRVSDLPVAVELAVQTREQALSVQIWKSYADEIGVTVVSPSGETVGPLTERYGPQRYRLGETDLLIYYGEPKPYSVRQEIYISFIPSETYIDSGVWNLLLTPGEIVDGAYEMWLPSQSALNIGTAFLRPSPYTTLTIPATSARVVSVSAYDALTFSYADFSGRGIRYEGGGNMAAEEGKPDIAAPGVRVAAPALGGGYGMFSGTSFAVPFVTGAAALLMEWGIVRGNDPYLYGEKVKAYLRKGAGKLPGYERWPNAELGWGILCLEGSLPL